MIKNDNASNVKSILNLMKVKNAKGTIMNENVLIEVQRLYPIFLQPKAMVHRESV